ncbi:MAG TPA: tetratricopeptide repeat protein [Casimicrobiaceae bacterium]|jgi:CRISPR-associated protein Csy1|nr:tetratricopeptide repeat protein [Casimicrobiaceae bacterium]
MATGTPADALAGAAARLQQGDAGAARSMLSTLLADAGLASMTQVAALRLRSRAAEAQGDLVSALDDLECVAALVPTDAKAWSELGVVRGIAGDRVRAVDALRRALVLDANDARTWNNLGSTLWEAGSQAEAIDAFVHATRLAPDYAHAFGNLGSALSDAGRASEAADALERAIALDPANVTALAKLASLRRNGDRLPEAIDLYMRAVRQSPANADLCVQLGRAMADADDLDGARRVFAEAVRRDATLLRARIGAQLMLPNVGADAADISRSRARYAEGLAALARELPQASAPLDADARLDALRWSNFLLAYQGEDDRTLQVAYGTLVASLVDAARVPARPRGTRGTRIRIGFVSSFFRDGTVGRYFASWITGLDRARFEIVLYDLRPSADPLATALRAAVDVTRALPARMPSAVARAIAADAPDVLVYPELGMDATTFALASQRLAPLQCAGWGHPVTTGHAAIDVFFSSDAMEPPDGASHYSEALVRLPGIGTSYRMPQATITATRAELGLPADRTLFLCPQSVFKIHPDDDALFAAVLAENPNAMLVQFAEPNPFTSARYRARLSRALEVARVDFGARVIYLPPMRHDRYLAVNAVCDAMLDTSRWSGGNTSLDAIAAGLPIVARPGRFMRARQSAGMLRLMGIDELVAGDDAGYRAIAARIARDRAWRDAQSAAITAHRARLFDDATPVVAFAEAITARLPEARSRFD